MSTLVPFGKYKGQPVERMIADRDYCEWLAGQEWFRSRYAQIHTLVINYGAEPEETPEHNRMQARFLDDAYCLAVAALVEPRLLETEAELYQRIVQEVTSGRDWYQRTYRKQCDREWSYGALERAVDEKRFEVKGWDVVYLATAGYQVFCDSSYEGFAGINRLGISVECKPSIGDDFPKVMRQMASRPVLGRAVLLVDSYAGSGVSFDQMRQMMKASGINVVLLSEVVP